jgi:NADH-quinone oxidoreductase subunit M
MGGFWKQMPFMGTVGMIFAMASLGLPGLGNFIAEFLILVGSWQASHKLTILATIGLVAATVYSLRIVARVFHGPEVEQRHALHDLTLREKLILVPLVVSIIWLGLFPQTVLEISKPTVLPLTSQSVNMEQKVQSSISEIRKGGNDE